MVGQKKRDPRAASAVDRSIGERIRARRLEIRLSQERLADALGITFQQVQKYEKGINRVSASTLIAISNALGISVVSLLPQNALRGKAASTIDSIDLAELSVAIGRLNDDGRRLVLSIAQLLAAQQALRSKNS